MSHSRFRRRPAENLFSSLSILYLGISIHFLNEGRHIHTRRKPTAIAVIIPTMTLIIALPPPFARRHTCSARTVQGASAHHRSSGPSMQASHCRGCLAQAQSTLGRLYADEHES